MNEDIEYQRRVQSQKDQYKTGADINALPDIYHYWSHKYLGPDLERIFGITSIAEFYAKPFAKLAGAAPDRKVRFVSIGSGDCSLESDIAECLLKLGHCNFSVVCLELNQRLLEEGQSRFSAKGIEDYVETVVFDANRDMLNLRADGFMAQHSLHHIVELERLFTAIDTCLEPDGRFLTIDMIGRNGHMRWPETLGFIDAFWNIMDDGKKYHHQLRQKYERFVDHDCSTEGFEGIRAQDILPSLVSRFSFEAFHAVGGIIDIFIDRGFGPNFDSLNPSDRLFIDLVADLNADLLTLGYVKPTMMFAIMKKRSDEVSPHVLGNLEPEFCVRTPTIETVHTGAKDDEKICRPDVGPLGSLLKLLRPSVT